MYDIDVTNKLTANKEKFLIFDNHKKNRNLVFSSPTGLRMLAESDNLQGDGTFQRHSKALKFI
jgi:hypothetical protein